MVESVRLLNASDPKQYYNKDRQVLEHFRFPDVFLRQTKKAYISFVTPEMIDDVSSLGTKIPTNYDAIRYQCWKQDIPMDMRFCRKVFASWLRKEGIQPEVVDMLQGRVSQSVLARHYLTPDSSLRTRVLDSLDRLKQAIERQ